MAPTRNHSKSSYKPRESDDSLGPCSPSTYWAPGKIYAPMRFSGPSHILLDAMVRRLTGDCRSCGQDWHHRPRLRHITHDLPEEVGLLQVHTSRTGIVLRRKIPYVLPLREVNLLWGFPVM
ncbi:hypothetical protein V2G26_004118 [Clonostachys chloroleuca]